jgi:hypothetical protein
MTRLSVILAALMFSVPSALAAGPRAPAGFGLAPKAKKQPQPGELVSGEASFALGGKQVRLPVAKGSIEKHGDVFVVWGSWRDSEKTENNFLGREGQELQLNISTQKPGPLVTKMQVTMSYARVEGTVSRLQGTSTCSLSLTELGEKSFAGEGSCTAGLLDAKGGPGLPITGIRFTGKAR